MGGYAGGELTLAKSALRRLQPGMPCLADHNFLGCELCQQAQASGAELLWRGKQQLRLARAEELADGSYLSRSYPSARDWRKKTKGIGVGVIEYRLEGVAEAESSYRLVTTILHHPAAPAAELAALYHQRWEIETAWEELKTPLPGAQTVLRSKTPDLVKQEF
jgi:DDE family transposase